MAPGMVLTTTLRVVHDKVSSLISRDFRLLRGFNNDLEKISQSLSSIQTAAEEVEKSLKQRFLVGFEKSIIDLTNSAVYYAEDLLEEIEIEALQWESQFEIEIEIGDMSCCSNQVSHSLSFQFKRLKIRKQIKQLRKRIEDDAFWSITVRDDLRYDMNARADPEEETIEITAEPIIYGRTRETESMIQLLLNNNTYHLSISPILGIPGLGKTTLAQSVYGDQRILANFDTRIWVSVVDDFSIEKIAQVMIYKLSGESCDVGLLDFMQNQLKLLLNGKKFLVVLDDVWNDDREKWNRIIHLLACGGKGSSIIVTTRLQTVVDNISNHCHLPSYIRNVPLKFFENVP